MRISLPLLVVLAACSSSNSQKTDAGGATAHDSASDSATTDTPATGATDTAPVDATQPAPITNVRVFFTDLSSGPNTGGESVSGFAGAYVTLYGNGFGALQGTSTVTLGGASCLRVVSWGTPWLWYQKIVVQLGPSCASGNFVVTTSAGASGDVIPFAVRAGAIYCVAPGGDDTQAGTFSTACWSTLANAASAVQAGDIVYLKDGVNNTTISNYNAVANITAQGTATRPIAYVGYPGATATIGDIHTSPMAVRVPDIGDTPNYTVLANLTLRGNEALDLVWADHWWIVGNDMSCDGSSGYSCVGSDNSTNLYVYGNNVHNTGAECASNSNTCKLYHAVYWSTDTNHVWMAYNLVDPDPGHTGVAGCRGVQFNSTNGSDQFDLHVYDNVIRNSICDGLNFATVDPGNGTVEAYNNVIYHVGTGPDPSGQASDYACVYSNALGTPTVPVKVYNNSFYDCGSRGDSDSGGISAAIPVALTNNSIESTGSSEPYVSPSTSCTLISGSNNDFSRAGAAPCASQLTQSLNVDPPYVNTSGDPKDLHLQAGSTLVGAGVAVTGLVDDHDGAPRATPPTLGAYQ